MIDFIKFHWPAILCILIVAIYFALIIASGHSAEARRTHYEDAVDVNREMIFQLQDKVEELNNE